MRITLSALLLLAVAALGGDETGPFGDEWKRQFEPEDDSWKSVKQELIYNSGAEPETLDPAVMTGVTEHTLALALYELGRATTRSPAGGWWRTTPRRSGRGRASRSSGR